MKKRVVIPDVPEENSKIPMGRTSSKLSPDLIDKFCKLIAEGLPADAACDYLGINTSTYYSWRTKGERFLEGNGQPKEDTIYGMFIVKFRKAVAEYRYDRIKSLHRKGNGLWVRDLAILERRDRKSFGRASPEGGDEEQFQKDEKFL